MPGDFCVRRQDYRTAEGYIMGAENKEQGTENRPLLHKEVHMKRLLYMLKRIIKGNNRYCGKNCMKCPYFKRCRRDGF